MLDYLEKHKTRLVYLPLIIYWLILLIATSLPGSDMPDIHVSDKIEHFTGYAILTILITFTLLVQSKYKIVKEKAYLATMIIVSVYAALDELHQLFIPGRDCDIFDWTTDFLAACFGILVVYSLVKLVRIKAKI
ncbi:MAG: VanZ family protein [Bacteroidetes bacterium]|nr:VanZ family protein [Bacteroidota bacterium]